MLTVITGEMLALSCFISRVSVSLQQRGGSPVATSFGANIHVLFTVCIP